MVGDGENDLTYAIGLANSQITNESAAESNIRDANVAQEAAALDAGASVAAIFGGRAGAGECRTRSPVKAAVVTNGGNRLTFPE